MLAEDRLLESKYADEATMVGSCRFWLCGECHSSLCLGDTPAMPKDAIANECNAALNMYAELCVRDVVAVATGGSLFHEHYYKCLVKLHGQLKCK